MRENNFTVGEMSMYSGIKAKTLRYYDEVGLFRPSRVDPETGYRYYTRAQFERLLLIKNLKQLGHTIDEIRQEMENMDSLRYLELLKDHAYDIEDRLRALENKHRNLLEWIQEVEDATSAPKDRCVLRTLPAITGYFHRTRIENRLQHELAMRELERRYNGGLYIGRVLRIVSREDLEQGNCLTYSALMIPSSCVQNVDDFPMTIPQREYAVRYYTALHEDSTPYWQELLEFIRTSGYRIAGDGIRSIPVEKGISSVKNDYIARICVPVVRERRHPHGGRNCFQKEY